MNRHLKSALIGSTALAIVSPACAHDFNIPRGDLKIALDAYMKQAGIALMYPPDSVSGVHSQGARGELPAEVALAKILAGTGFSTERTPTGAIGIVREERKTQPARENQIADALPVRAAASVETVVVTSSKIKGDIQTVPIAITALSQEQLTSRQIAGGPDLVKEVPNLTFSKTNFTGYNIEIRGIGTQAISVTTDPAVAVAFNDTPFIRNHFFEQEFFDVSQVQVLRGPQGTLYGRNATAGVVNVVSAKPTDQFEAMLSADWGNYTNRRYEGMVNLPIVGDKLALRIAGEWTKRDGYSFNSVTNKPIDGRDLWSSRMTLRWHPVESVTADFIWEHFAENDDRLRSGKQLCKTDYGPGATSLTSAGSLIAADGTVVPVAPAQGLVFGLTTARFSQGCLPASLYAPESFQVPNGFSLPFVTGAAFDGLVNTSIDPYSQTTQSTNLRDIQSAINPRYRAKNDTLEFNASWNVTPALTLYSDTGYNHDFLWSTEDYNRFTTSPGIFIPGADKGAIDSNGVFCDPQLGCSDRLVVQDLSTERAWQLSQEFRLASNFEGPFNFSAGGNYLHYETWENYYVFSNTFTMIALDNVCTQPGVTTTVQNSLECLKNERGYIPHPLSDINSIPTESPQYIDPHPLTALDNEGHNYFVSQNPYVLNSYAVFGETYYNVTPDLKLTAGLRWTDDEKHFISIPSELLVAGYGYPRSGVVDQAWRKYTGRFVANWSPKLDFTDQSMFYASYARGYKAGGENPPGAILLNADVFSGNNITFPVHPLSFKPEFVNAYEAGTKNTLLDGALTLNGDVFFYDYKGYQISQIVDRSSINLNFDATVKGAELEMTYEPLPGLKLSFAGGYEDTNIKKNQYAIDLMDRTAGVPGWIVAKPSVGEASNCIIPEYVAAAMVQVHGTDNSQGSPAGYICGDAYVGHIDPVTGLDYVAETGNGAHAPYGVPSGYPGYDPNSADANLDPALLSSVNNGLGLPPNNGEGFAKNVGGNELPNAPHYTASLTADYTMPVSANWAATLHGDFYWQSQSFARVFNDRPYDKIRGYSNVNTALILTDASGWQVMGYVKNIFNTTAITGDFLNSDDSGLTTNIFLTDPRLYGVRITKHFDGGADGALDIFSNDGAKKPQLWLQLGGVYDAMIRADKEAYAPPFSALLPDELPTPQALQKTPGSGFDWDGKLTYQPDGSDWKLMASIRYGRSGRNNSMHKSLDQYRSIFPGYFSTASQFPCSSLPPSSVHFCTQPFARRFVDAHEKESERHTILDFTIGRDIGIGVFNGKGTSTLSAGIRVAEFKSRANGLFNSDPDYNPADPFFVANGDIFNVDMQERRSFHGIGPEIAWDSSNPVLGTPDKGEVSVDLGLNAGLLFGRQKADGHHATSQCHFSLPFFSAYPCTPVPSGSHEGGFTRSKNVTVPNLGGYIGASVQYQSAKISLGYRADEFFNAMDGGQATAKKYNRGFYGPYLNLSIGFGG